MYRYYNPHPKGIITDDCVKRAISIATNQNYNTVSKNLNGFKKVTGARFFNTDKNPHYFVEDILRGEKIHLAEKMTAEMFCEKYPSGRYILDMKGHWSCCIDGVIYDTWDCSDKTVNFAYKINIKDNTHPDMENQIYKYACTSKSISDTQDEIRIYDGNGNYKKKILQKNLTSGYITCLEDQNYKYIKL